MDLIRLLFPHLAGVRMHRLHLDGDAVGLEAVAEGPTYGRYVRQLMDAPVGGRRVRLSLVVRRFFCDNTACVKKTFAEQIDGLTVRFGRQTVLARELLQAIALAAGGRPGQRLARQLAVPVSRMTLLRIIRHLPDPPVGTPEVLGVDEFAIRKGQTYATILLDMATHRPIDVLPDRSAESFADWLREHPGVRVICRDRGGSYAEGARSGALQAIQVADRYHLWANLGEAVDKIVWAHRGCLPEPAPPPIDAQIAPEAAPPVSDQPPADIDTTVNTVGEPRRLVTRTQEQFAAVHELTGLGLSWAQIGRQLGLDWRTVRKFAQTSLPELLEVMVTRKTKLDAFKPYLNQRWNSGCTDGMVLFAEIKARGYTGGLATVHRYLHPFRATVTRPARPPGASRRPEPAPAPPKPRRVGRWILTRPDRLKPGDAIRLKQILARCPQLEATAAHVAAFADMMAKRSGAQQLDQRIHDILADDLPALHSLVNGMRRDHDAIVNGLSLPYSSGAVEGAVTRAKAIKRAYYGRANLDLLRKRILQPS